MFIILFIILVISPATSFHHPLSSKRSLRQRHYPKTQTSQSSFLSRLDDSDRISSPSDQNNDYNRPTIIFPGGGLFFYWQAGVVVSIEWRYCLCIAGNDNNFSHLLYNPQYLCQYNEYYRHIYKRTITIYHPTTYYYVEHQPVPYQQHLPKRMSIPTKPPNLHYKCQMRIIYGKDR